MASPQLSRSPSAHFAPGPHRRSHPNLQNLHTLSLAPLTPKYPIDPSDYDAYYDPVTSELHTSSSLSRIAGLPSPGGILSNSPARSRSTSRKGLKRKVKSHVNFQDLSIDTSVHDKDDEVVDHKPAPKSKSHVQLSKLRVPDPSWLVQTGLSLTESSRETKGQSWITKRDSSTSLANTPVDGGHFELKRPREGRTPRSARATPAGSRVGSRVTSRNASRTRMADLRMTSVSPDAVRTSTPGASFATAPESSIHEQEEDELRKIEPNWSDARTQAELAAQLQEELSAEYEDDDGDPYGMLDFEGQDFEITSEDEEEVRRAMRSWRVGGWMDGAIEALLMVEEGRGEQDTGRQTQGRVSFDETVNDGEVPPERARDLWDDLGWFGRVMKRNLGI